MNRCSCYVLPHADDCALLLGITRDGERVYDTGANNMSKMGTPANGYTKPRPTQRRPTMSVREAVAKYGDSWRVLGEPAGFGRQVCETWTQADGEGFTMSLMERGILPRVDSQ